MRSDITPGQTSDYLGFELVMDDNLPEPCVLLADRGYDSDKVRKTMEARNVVPVIPMRKSRKLRVAVDRTLYRLRNFVERCFNKLKNARRVATRYDKTAESFLGFIDITSIRLWLSRFVHDLEAGHKAKNLSIPGEALLTPSSHQEKPPPPPGGCPTLPKRRSTHHCSRIEVPERSTTGL